MDLVVDGLSIDLGGRRIVDRCSLTAESGQVVGLIGPNGSGKSTLLRAIYRSLRPAEGTIRLGDHDLLQLPLRQSARYVAAVPQESAADFDFSVDEIVMMGRAPHKRALERPTRADREIVDAALDQVGVADLADRTFLTLSGGEKQRVLIARAIAQQSQLLVLDEPTNHLDVHAQLELMELTRSLATTTVVAMHDLNLAAAYCDRLTVIDNGRIVAHGTPEAILDPGLLARVFNVDAHCGPHPSDGRFHVHLRPLRPAPHETPTERTMT